ncbi:MAG: D-alanyl-lipoteichoic acid biosynthesis protein DltD [Rhizonema sp. PD37]|nr:D-alanyl-lipoteichoic acid biosynthesis protein DltD [Rhizonema sp. PD37]
MKIALPDSQQSLVQWVSQATGISTFGVKIRLRGNDLHILCEGQECPKRWRTLSDLLQALQQTNIDVLTSGEPSSIYQVIVYGRKKGEKRPEWYHRVYLNQLGKHLEQAKNALIEGTETTPIPPGGALVVSNESLARQGNPDAIARYLSEMLSSFGVAVEVKVREQKPDPTSSAHQNRLWVFCHSSYTPDPSLIALPVAQKLRELELSGYQDALIASQVNGETKFDWLLRIDLTPPEVMLREWARWGDVQAIVRLLNAALSESLVAVEATLSESTLHLFCSSSKTPVPEQTLCVETIKPLLEAIAPQGIVSVAVYGQQKSTNLSPDWVDWISLPGSEYPALAISVLDLASSGDEPAIVFLLERLLNPDLDSRLQTGGTRVLLLYKGDLLHIMCDAPICPKRKQTAGKVIQLVRQLKISGIVGVRVYGRRAGNKEPNWQYGADFHYRRHLVPEATPEFAATSAYVGELLPEESHEPLLRPDLTTSEVQSFVTDVARDSRATARQFLLGTQIFVESDSLPKQTDDPQGLRVALVWGTLGLLLTLQIDWVLAQILDHSRPPTPIAKVSPQSSLKNGQSQRSKFAHTSKKLSSHQISSVFNASEFTQTDNTQDRSLTAEPLKQKATATAILLAARSRTPSFNVRQLDEQLALYRQRLAKTGKPPQVLIIGSSRALRGVDPAALSLFLATQGYSNINVFNFGVNGATAQVIDFIIRQVLTPSELPKLIVWADGSRAFNSGREDVTFKAIVSSLGYKQVLQKATSTANSVELSKTVQTTEESSKTEKQHANSYQAVNQWLNQSFAAVSSTYQKRDSLKNFLNKQLKSLPIIGVSGTQTKPVRASLDAEEDTSQQAVDFDGFLPLSIRFRPGVYYQKHPKVSGNYDNDYKSFNLEGEQETALQTVLNFTQSHNITVVFVNTPLTSDYLDPVRTKYEQEFQQYMLRLTERPKFVYRDLSQAWPTANNYFSDPSHLNRYGAYEVSKKLAIDPIIPWSSK